MPPEWEDTTILPAAEPPHRGHRPPRRRIFPGGWRDFLLFAWSLPGLGLSAVLAEIFWRLRGH